MRIITMSLDVDLSFRLSVAFCLAILLSVCSVKAQEIAKLPSIPKGYKQAILVTSKNWDSSHGTLQILAREDGVWEYVGGAIPVSLGQNGLAWGRGLHADELGLQKKEGDRRAPAGIFEIGTGFGYAAKAPEGVKITYKQATDRDYFIDDVDSEDYNSWQSIPDEKDNDPKNYWNSFERIRRSDHLYELGFVIDHNMNQTASGFGSAIFFHIWRQQGSPTVGCTATSKENVTKVMKWLNPDLKPLLIQAPQDVVERLRFKEW